MSRLSPFSLTGEWPKTGKGNRAGKAPVRYFGRFFYTTGTVSVAVPAGEVRVEVWKGLEYRPSSLNIRVAAGDTRRVALTLERAVDGSALGYDSGDPHLHFPRVTEHDEDVVFDLMDAEDIDYGALLGYNEPAGPYTATETSSIPPSFAASGRSQSGSGATGRLSQVKSTGSRTYGHLNLFLRDDLVREGESFNANNWPLSA